MPRRLDSADQQQNDHNEEDEAHSSERTVAPIAAMVPPRKGAHQTQDQHDDQYGC